MKGLSLRKPQLEGTVPVVANIFSPKGTVPFKGILITTLTLAGETVSALAYYIQAKETVSAIERDRSIKRLFPPWIIIFRLRKLSLLFDER